MPDKLLKYHVAFTHPGVISSIMLVPNKAIINKRKPETRESKSKSFLFIKINNSGVNIPIIEE